MSVIQKIGQRILTAESTGQRAPSVLTAERIWQDVSEVGYFEHKGPDENARPGFVSFQAFSEATIAAELKKGHVKSAVGIIHTPVPATPLRVDGTNTEGLVNDDIAADLVRLATVLKRANIVRDFMKAGGVLVSYYPKSALDNPPEGMKTFERETYTYPKTLVNAAVGNFDPKMTGASYIITENDGTVSAFSLMAYQANTVEEHDRTWAVWLGEPENNALVQQRLEAVREMVEPRGVDIDTLMRTSQLEALEARLEL